MKKIYNYLLLLICLNLFFTDGISQQIQLKTEVENFDSGDKLKCMTGFIDNSGNAISQEVKSDYVLELLPGTTFTGSRYYYVTGTTGASETANLTENPPVDWLQISPAQFTDYVDGLATKVDYIFTVPNYPTLLSTTIIDQNGNWQNLNISVIVTESPNLNLTITDVQLNTNENYVDYYSLICPVYFYFSTDNQYYYISQMAFNYSEHLEKPWFNILPASFTLLPDEVNTVTLSANIPTPGSDSLIVFKNVQLYSFPSFTKYNFDVSGTSYLEVLPSNQSVPYSSGTTTFTLNSNVAWTLSDDASWLTVTPASGSNNATLNASYLANTTGAPRTATIIASGTDVSPVTVTVSQAANPTLTVTPSNRDVTAPAGTTTFTVNSNTSWVITESVSWLTASPMSGSSNGTLTVNYNENTSSLSRTGQINVTTGDGSVSVNVTVTQAGVCTFTISPLNQNVPYTSGSATFTITSNSAWTITDNATWLTVSPSSGSGNATITATYTENTNSNSRTSLITATGCGNPFTVTVAQAGNCSFSLSPANLSLPADAGSTTVNITANGSWSASESLVWIAITPSSGTGNATITITYSANTGTARTGVVTFDACGNQTTMSVSQSAPCNFSVSPSTRNVSFTQGTTTFSITSNTSWTVTDDVTWLAVGPSGGTGNGTITAYYSANNFTSTRTATITINACGNSYQVTVVQDEEPCEFVIDPTNHDVAYTSGGAYFYIYSNSTWSLTDDATWLSVTPTNGIVNGILTASFTANTGTSTRIATITVYTCGTSYTATVTQTPSCSFSISPANQEVSSLPGTTTFAITSNDSWTVTDDVGWLTVSPSNGSNNGTLTANFEQNTTYASRIGTITVTACATTYTVTVTQNAPDGVFDVINLDAGWNLISFDVTLQSDLPSDVFQPLISVNNLEIVSGFQNQIGVFFDPDGLPFLNTLQHLIEGEGYWVKVTNPATITVFGQPLPPDFMIDLETGWNLVGYWLQASTTPANAFSSLISAGVLEIVTGYDSGGKFFDPNGPPFLNTLLTIDNGKGYWVKMNANYPGFSYP